MPIIIGTANSETSNGSNQADYIAVFEGDDTVFGLDGNDFIYGGDGNDLLNDGLGADHMFGQNGDDRFVMGAGTNDGADFVDGGAGVDFVRYTPMTNGIPTASPGGTTTVDFQNPALNAGLAAGDWIVGVEGYQGGRGQDFVFGSADNNIFIASLGRDYYDGRAGQDMYRAFIADPGETLRVTKVEIAFGQRAVDLGAQAGVTVTLGYGVAYYEVWRDANSNGIQDTGEVTKDLDQLLNIEYLAGTTGNDIIAGSAADETINPISGVDTLNGGAGYDFLSYETLLYGPVIGFGVEVDLQAGTAHRTNEQVLSSVTGFEGIVGSSSGDQLLGDSGDNKIAGGDGNDALDGRAGNDTLAGGAGIDILVGGLGDDILNGGEGRDVLDGSEGRDLVSYSTAKTSIAVSLLTGQGLIPTGTTTYQGNAAESISDVVLNVEDVVGSIYGDVISGDNNANSIEGRRGSDLLIGCGGDDVIFGDYDPASKVAIFVHQNDYADGNIANDCDCMIDEGDDDGSYAFDNDRIEGGDGNDVVYGQLGDDNICGCEGDDALSGGNGSDVINGEEGNDVIDGGAGSDILNGGAGNDAINGGPGFDIIIGGEGVDTVYYDASNTGVTVSLSEFWRNSGGDASSDLIGQLVEDVRSGDDITTLIQSAMFLNLISILGSDGDNQSFGLRLPDVILGVENVVGSNFDDTLTGDENSNYIRGLAGADRLEGADGDDLLEGGAGADTLVGGRGSDGYDVDNTGDVVVELAGEGNDIVYSSVNYTLPTNVESVILMGSQNLIGVGNGLDNLVRGNSGANQLYGLDGADTLDGGIGADSMYGGLGDDTYIVDNSGDAVIEVDGAGIDTVLSSVSFNLAGQAIERLLLQGTGSINGVGNGLSNLIVGNSGDNILDGGAGADTLSGGLGNDTYVVDNAGDMVLEDAGAGVDDRIQATVSISLSDAQDIERVFLLGAEALSVSGNSSANALFGNTAGNVMVGGGGADILYGRLGNDLLLGGSGADQFVFDTALSATDNVDRLSDFFAPDDAIILQRSVFASLALGALDPAQFRNGPAALDSDDRIIYDQATGALFYDADGNGAGAAVQFAQLPAGAGLSAADFFVI